MSIKVSASILSADLCNLSSEISLLEKSGADYIHFDVMDGQFVPNLTFGIPLVKSARKCTNIPFDVHLMINNPDNYISDFVAAGANIISVHAEACVHLDRTLESIKSLGCRAGLAINPATSEEVIRYVSDVLDYVLVMTVNPGFYGQKFIESQLTKISRIKSLYPSLEVCVDGGINNETARLVREAGADTVVSASYIFQDHDYASRIRLLKE